MTTPWAFRTQRGDDGVAEVASPRIGSNSLSLTKGNTPLPPHARPNPPTKLNSLKEPGYRVLENTVEVRLSGGDGEGPGDWAATEIRLASPLL